ncbi:MAG: hypothetical protein Athens101410_615 [Parcubacteria group bacterium Athens1014_10]|nr:MAG: hypothetical protein Athens101410_615 [Parcubacteria group bacterium Athens1014_10]TSD04801.1 MAG: hypothetical protein Athens071412_585 [Parcubacteria group bacterium Athens0714_12]
MHQEVLKLEGREIFQRFKNFPEFYLAGGTALALQIGHRISIDFDLFSKKDIPSNFLNKVEKIFRDKKLEVIVNNSEQLSLNVSKTKVDFVKYSFPLIFKPIKFQCVNILKIPEIAAMKAYTLGRRGTLKDYIDLYFLLGEKHISLKKIIEIAQKKYKEKFDPRLFLEQLIYLDDIEDIEIQFLRGKITKIKLQKFFEKEIKNLSGNSS